MADHGQQVDETVQLFEPVVVAQKTYPSLRPLPALLVADRVEHVRRNLEDELLAVFGIGKVHRVVGVDQQQLARHQVMLALLPAPQAVAVKQHLQVIDGFQGR
ncbi:hypothetical protein D3C81_1992270 [compost metagenome]